MAFKLSVEEVRLILDALSQFKHRCGPEEIIPQVLGKLMDATSKEEAEVLISDFAKKHTENHEMKEERVTLLQAKLIGIRDEMLVDEVTKG